MSRRKIKDKQPDGMRIIDAEYPPGYANILKSWMDETGHHNFELDLIKEGLMSPELKKCLLGLDYILESRAPGEDVTLDFGMPKNVSLRPEVQLRAHYERELERFAETEQIVNEMNLTAHDFSSMNPGSSFLAGGLSELSLLGFPEPIYSDLCRNSPEDLKMSCLRSLREDGYFDDSPLDVRVTAYLMAKGFRTQAQVESFSPVIDWQSFQSAQGKIYQAIRKNWPDRFARFEKVFNGATATQKEAFISAYDIDERPTRTKAAEELGISVSSLNARLSGLRDRLMREFSELPKRAPKWKPPESEAPVKDIPANLSDAKVEEIRAWLRSFSYKPDVNVDLSGSKRGDYQLQPGECAQHPTAWRAARLKAWIQSNLWPTESGRDQHEATEWAYELGLWGQERDKTPCDRPPKAGEPGFRAPQVKSLYNQWVAEANEFEITNSLVKSG